MRFRVLAMVLVAIACGEGPSASGGEETGGEPPAEPVPRAEAAAAMVSALCALNEECLCAPGCAQNSTWPADQILNIAEVLGLDYDPQCMGELVRRVAEGECDLVDAQTELECESSCRPFFGTRAAGEACSASASWVSNLQGFRIVLDECDADNVCIGGVCQPRCRVVTGVPEGEPCWIDACAEGLICELQLETCVDGPGVGDSCMETYADCGEGWCETIADICQPMGQRGDPCSSYEQCDSGYCPNGTCQARPSAGEECYGPCEDGYRCSSSVCIPYVCWH